MYKPSYSGGWAKPEGGAWAPDSVEVTFSKIAIRLWTRGRSTSRSRSGAAGAAQGGLVGDTEGTSNRFLGTSASVMDIK